MAIYLVLFFVGLGFLLLSTLMGGALGGDGDGGDGGDGEAGGDAAGDVDAPHLPSPFSPRSIAATATGFGAGGALSLLNGVEGNPSLAFAVAGGLVVGGGVYGFLLWLANQQRSTHLRREELVGKTGTVVTAIGAPGVGEVSVLAAGQSSIHLARSAAGTPIPRGSQVRVEALGGDAVLVRPLAEAPGDPE